MGLLTGQSDRRSWRFSDGVLAMGLAALAVFATLDVWRWILETGLGNEEQSHVLLAPVVAAWLFWVRRMRLRLCRAQRSLWGPVLVGLGWGLVVLGFSGGWDVFMQFGSLVMVIGAVVSALGTDPLRHFAPAFAVLLFVLPVPGRIRIAIAQPLQEWSAVVTVWLLELFGAPVSRSGNIININGAEVAIAEACNGMRMVAALGLVTFAFVFSMPMRNSIRLLLLALSPVLALMVNVIRLGPTALWYGFGKESSADLFHDIAGWGMLGVALGMLWCVLALMKWVEIPIAPYAVAEDER